MEKYERIRVVGRGAFGIVHLCLRKADQKLVIIKQIPVEQMTKEERQAAQNECQVLKLLNHPNVIEYYENFLEDKALMIAMEYAPGGTLAEFIQKRCNSLLEEETILHFFVQILLALHHVHTHLILHRDLKTQNILLDKHRMVVKIGDFGISKILSSKSKAYTVPGHGGDLKDRGIIMTFGSGSNGCLGHGSLNDISQPTIVEALLGYEMVQVACGASHVLALSTERELFAWGRGDGGRLGLGTRESHSCPQQVPMPPGQEAQRVVCGIDSSMILTVPGQALACGSNRFNKLGLDHLSLGEEPAPHQQVEEALSFTPLGSAPLEREPLLSVDLGTAHSAAVTASGDCYTFGSNQHGQLGTIARRVSRVPCQVQGLQGIKIAMVACGDAFTVAIGAESEVYSWGKGARGRLGRRDEDAGLPRPVQLDETHPYTVTSVSCCHGNTLLAIRPVTDEPVPP
ncbi:Serine/threonine-protein kinase Nek8, partial [Eschrichtius robustus]|nr:Serine/threonine-protein kinase Nek8 [Eschrichtius robustus]